MPFLRVPGGTLVVCAALLSLVPAHSFAQADVTTQHNDLGRTGATLTETTLNVGNVNVAQFGKLFERVVDDQIYAQPLYVSNVNIPGVGVRNIVYVATVSNSVYAFDADNPAAVSPLWHVSYINPPTIVPVHRSEVGGACGTYLDFSGNIGIVGTPVIDTATHTMYFVVRTKENGIFVQRLHAVDIRTGAARPGSPRQIQVSIAGTGDGADEQGNLPFNSRTQNQRAGLLLLNGVVYIAWGSHCEDRPYHGWILGYDAASLNQVMVFNTTPNGRGGGIWQSGQGLTADPAGNIYALTGSGTFDGNGGGSDFGLSFLKISPTGTLLDWFTPHNWSFLSTTDADASMGALVVPNTNLVLGGGKPGLLYVLNRDNMGHHNPAGDTQIVQSLQASSAGRMYATPIYWDSPTYGPVIYTFAASDPLKAFRLVNGRFETVPAGQSPQVAQQGMPGGMMSLSANGSGPGTGIVWTAMSSDGNANQRIAPGVVRAHDAGDVTRELWNSEQNPNRDRLGNFSKFSPPTIANGKVYVPTFSNKLVVYGLLSAGPGNAAPVVNAGADQSITLPATATLSATATDDGNPNPPGSLTFAWTVISGPGQVVFSAPTALATTASFSAAGTYTLRLTVSDSAASTTDNVGVTVYPPMGSGSGVNGFYYNDSGSGHFTTLARARQDATVNFNWGNGSPDPLVNADNFSVRWTGYVQAPVSGGHVFRTISNDGVRLWVNGQLLINNWTDHATTIDTSASVALVSGRLYPIILEYYDRTGHAEIQLQWSYGAQQHHPIPQSHLYPPAAVNQPPSVNAGTDQSITLPAAGQLRGTATDDGLPIPPGALTVRWTKISGREDDDNPVVIANPDALETSVTFPAADVYVFRLTVSDGAVTVSDDVTINVSVVPNGDGVGLTGQYYSGLNFETLVLTRTDATVNFDWAMGAPAAGLPVDNFTVRWTGRVRAVVTGQHTFTATSDDGVRLWVNGQLIVDNWVNQPETTVVSAPVSLVADTLNDIRYEFFDHHEDAIVRLLWSYPGQATATIPQSQLYPAAGQQNQPPTVNAGADREITLPAVASLAGIASDDGLPNPPGSITTTWSRTSGPGTVTFGNANALTTSAAFSNSGSYVLRLTVSDGTLTTSDELTVVVNPPAPNQAPNVNAGPDQTITLPNSASLNGTASDDGLPSPPGLLTISWTRVSGPAPVTFGNAAAPVTTASFTAAGTYVLRLTASDGSLTTNDDLTIVVNPAGSGGGGTGLTGRYYNDAGNGLRFTSLVLTRVDPNVDFNWLRTAPAPAVNPDNFSVRWTGEVLAPATGSFTFVTSSDDGVRLWVNDQLIIDNWGNHPLMVDTSPPVSLVEGVRYPIRLEFWDGVKDAIIRLHWTYPGQATQAIPQALLFPVAGAPVNQPPTANAGADQTITLPSTAGLAGTATDDGLPNPPATLTTTWSVVSGPGTVTFGNAASLSTTASFSAAGAYVLRLTASDSASTATDDLNVAVNGPANQGPTVNAGPDRAITLPATASLAGSASDDGLPNPPGTLTTTWSVVSGPGTVTFGNPASPSTTASFTVAGAYMLRLTASDSVLTATDQMEVTVSAANHPPTANAGADQSIALPSTASLAGTATDDGLPNPPATLTTTWSRVSGPGTVTFGNAASLSTTASFSAAGAYVLRLTASDSVLTATDDLNVTVNPPVNQAPTVSAGADQAITLPAAAILSGTASDDGRPNPPATLTTTWSRVSGPGTVTFGNAASLSTTASFSAAGTYVLRLTASDSALNSADDMTIVVGSSGGQGAGLTGEYFDGVNNGTLRHTRVDPTVDFNWARSSPAPNVAPDNFSVRWTGQVLAPVSGSYVFSTVSDDGVRLWVNDQLVINNWTDRGQTTNNSAPIALVAGGRYTIRLEYHDRTKDAIVHLRWSFPGQATQTIPQSQLFP